MPGEVRLVRATAAQSIEANKRSHVEWAKGLSVDEYLSREETLGRCKVAQGLLAWVLIPRSAPTDTLDFFCACETYRRRLFAHAPRLGQPGQSLEGIGYGICSVFTPQRYRGKGYAGQMMKLLHAKLAKPGTSPFASDAQDGDDEDGPRDATLSVLYSDAGTFYQAHGWTIIGALHTIWPVQSVALEVKPQLSTERLDDGMINSCAKQDVAATQRQVYTSADTAFAFVPTGDEQQWLVTRSKFYHEHLPARRGHSPPTTFGARVITDHADSLESHSASEYAVWNYDYSGSELNILRLRVNSPEALEALMVVAVECAREQECQTITAWNVDTGLLKSAGLVSQTKKSSLPALAIYDDHLRGADWLVNENLFWC
ncbi:uncharacterized protein L969DRAFT_54976 [Mixia osmundae IAM 14324]|uniref:LYC1 C-terminal domain-containing protein n=1 Tax=Mixia osmundae (strain CBS 9802 / IAM 14324 / JCM 22182 / KY 12970) TaxID=764103 RepID=G7DW61_MIXOS|nr:uncharacterized protein L969DRAFT_54976 [Mixia osmundae IAM 14324]KEI36436.1 hypothetical protein L969DRAFT_54976 [Mixia osmundae IAM 14324]GAA94867.1 hypothetical protein E5Q_01521 [Mixia osmundae IAM 14324]